MSHLRPRLREMQARHGDRFSALQQLIVGFDDYPAISAAYKTIIERLRGEIPNIDTDRSIIGGHSNGAKTVNVLLTSMDETTLATFNALFFVDAALNGQVYQ